MMHLRLGVFVTIFTFCVKFLNCNAVDNFGYTSDAYQDAANAHTERNYNSMLCNDIKPQHSLDIQHIMGTWHGSEILMHTHDVPGVFRYDTCVIITLSDISDQMHDSHNYNYNNNNNNYRRTYTPTPYNEQHQHQQQQQQQQQQNQQRQHDDNYAPTKYLRLVWNEKDDNLEYTFNYTDHSPGLWTNIDEQRGSLVALNQYTQFSGTVQVVKAVNDHLVLTFCGNDSKSSVYTIVLSRSSKGLSSDELRSIRNLLSRRGLHAETIRQVCTSAAAATAALKMPAVFLLLLGFLSILRKF